MPCLTVYASIVQLRQPVASTHVPLWTFKLWTRTELNWTYIFELNYKIFWTLNLVPNFITNRHVFYDLQTCATLNFQIMNYNWTELSHFELNYKNFVRTWNKSKFYSKSTCSFGLAPTPGRGHRKSANHCANLAS